MSKLPSLLTGLALVLLAAGLLGASQVNQAVEPEERIRMATMVDRNEYGVELARCYYWMVEYWGPGGKISEGPVGSPSCVRTLP